MINKCWLCIVLFLMALCNDLVAATHRSDIRIRDPFVLVDHEAQIYYLYAQMQNREGASGQGVEVYTSRDLEWWQGPHTVYEAEQSGPPVAMVWAPEVHRYRGRYYLFVTLTLDETLGSASASPVPPPQYVRGTHILAADRPSGPFKPLADHSATPPDRMALDGTLLVEDGVHYMVYCHEWAQIHVGSMELVQLSADLGATVGGSERLFEATEAPWVMNMMESLPDARYDGYVTDGPWFYRTRSGKLQMIWSSFGAQRYAIGLADSLSGSVRGPWVQRPEPLFPADGGHGMMFLDLEGRMRLVFHAPNSRGEERLVVHRVTERDDSLILALP